MADQVRYDPQAVWYDSGNQSHCFTLPSWMSQKTVHRATIAAWHATAPSRAGFEHGLDVQLDGDLVADDDLLTFAGGGANAVVRSPDRRGCRDPDPMLALQSRLVEAEELDVQGEVAPSCTVRPALSKVMSGWRSTSKKLTDRRSSSRIWFAVFTDLMEIVAAAEQSVGCSAILT
jgi:hypothetical protein